MCLISGSWIADTDQTAPIRICTSDQGLQVFAFQLVHLVTLFSCINDLFKFQGKYNVKC